jgi:acyl dehydratase
MRRFADLDELRAAAGEHLGYSDWTLVEQDRVNQFADATGDHQWIHVDPERAKAGPFGTTIAHGYLTLSLLPMLAAQVYRVEGIRMGINYGLNRCRFPATVPTGSRVRLGLDLLSVDDVEGGVQVAMRATIERENGDKPCCVAETLTRFYP